MTRRPDGWNSGQMSVRTRWLDRPDGWQGTWILLTYRLWIVESLFTASLHLSDFVQTQNEAKILTATIFSCKFMLSDFMSFWFLIVLLQFNYWDDSWISIVIYEYMWWFEIVSFNWLPGFLFIKVLYIHCVSFFGYIWWFGLNRISFLICAKNGFIEWFNDFLQHSRTYIRFV
jgi:hypothetical protein